MILGILQDARKVPTSIKSLIEIGALFGFTDNSIRVTNARLICDGVVEQDARGQYRISQDFSVVNQYITSWKLGDSRTIPWDGSWIACWLPRNQGRHKLRNQRSLSLLGFQEGMPKFWVRPNNLSMAFDDLKAILFRFGLDEKAELFIAHKFSESLTGQWKLFLWPIEDIIQRQLALEEKLRNSADRIDDLPFRNALVETYRLGSEAIYLLLTDPLLPAEMMSNASRLSLTRTMLEYNVLGKEIWRKRFDDLHFTTTPSYIELPTETMH